MPDNSPYRDIRSTHADRWPDEPSRERKPIGDREPTNWRPLLTYVLDVAKIALGVLTALVIWTFWVNAEVQKSFEKAFGAPSTPTRYR